MIREWCEVCEGAGYIEFPNYDWDENPIEPMKTECCECNGKGYVDTKLCKKTTQHIEFLKKLQQTLRTQETDYQASPRYWVLRQYEYMPAGDGWMDKYLYTYNDGDFVEFGTTKELIDFLKDHEIITGELLRDIENLELGDVFDYVYHNYNDDNFFDIIPAQRVEKIIPNTMFITKEDAERHIEANRHHYNDTVHTYAMTAWRSPTVSKLWEVLENMDWDSIR